MYFLTCWWRLWCPALDKRHCKMLFNFAIRHDHAWKSYQTRWLLIGLRNLILIDDWEYMMKTNKSILSHPHRCKWFKYRMLCHSKQKMQTKVAYSVCSQICRVTVNACITTVWFNSKSFLFDVNYMFRSLWICYHDINFTYGNHSINQDSAHWPMGIKMHRAVSGYLVRKLNREVMRY